jgi:hypothetical protein
LARLTVKQQIANDAGVVDQVRVRRLGLDKVLQEIGLALGEVLVLALGACGEVLDGDARDVADVGRADGVDGVLVQDVVGPRHLAAEGKVVDRLVGGGERPVKVVALLHVAKLAAEGHHAHEIPGV